MTGRVLVVWYTMLASLALYVWLRRGGDAAAFVAVTLAFQAYTSWEQYRRRP